MVQLPYTDFAANLISNYIDSNKLYYSDDFTVNYKNYLNYNCLEYTFVEKYHEIIIKLLLL